MSKAVPVSPWFTAHRGVFREGVRALDVACGSGRHAIAAAKLRARVVAVDADAAKLATGKRDGRRFRRAIEWKHADLELDPIPPGPFDVVLVFNYLDRARMPEFLDVVKTGGYMIAETFLREQRSLETGPRSDEHLLERGELISLVQPFQIVHAREVLEVIDECPRFVSSVLARRLKQ